MFKYMIWGIRVGFLILWHQITWMYRYGKHPERYSQEDRFRRGSNLGRKVLKGLQVDIEIRNAPTLKEGEVYFFVANHTSLLDAVVTLGYLPTEVKYVSKQEVKRQPFVSTMFAITGGVYIERDNLKQEIKAMQAMRESLMSKDSSWMVFPEGTRKKDYHLPLLEYKAGTFKAPLQAGTTIVPLIIWGTQTVLPRKTRAKRYLVIVEYLDPFKPEGTTGEIAQKVYEDSLAVSEKLRREYKERQKLNKFGTKMIEPPMTSSDES